VTSVLKRLGETEATIRSLERLVAVADDPAVRQEALTRLQALRGEQAQEEFRRRVSLLTRMKSKDLPALSRTVYQLVGPDADPRRCIGVATETVLEECATSFAQLD
jgi:hypothetical protein